MQVTGNVTAIQSGTAIVQNQSYAVGKAVPGHVTADESSGERYTPSKEGMTALAQEFMERLQAAGTELESLQKQGDGNPYEDSMRAMRIAMNMMRGKRVPPKDEQCLMEYSNELYQAAKMVQMMQEQKEDAESELEDEDAAAADKTRKLALDSAGEALVDSFDRADSVPAEEAAVQVDASV